MKTSQTIQQSLGVAAFAAIIAMGVSTASAVEIWATNNLSPNTNEIITFDSSDPANWTVVGETGITDSSGAASGVGGLDFDGSGNLYGFVSYESANGTGTSIGLYSINTSTGNATAVGQLNVTPLQDLSWDPETQTMYGIFNNVDGEVELHEVDLNSGAVTAVGTFTGLPAGALATGLGHDSDGNIYVQELVSNTIWKSDAPGSLTLASCHEHAQDANFSQGIVVDWRGDDSGYHGTLGNVPGFFSELYVFNSGCTTYDLLGNFGTDQGTFPTVETGDLAIIEGGSNCPDTHCPWDIQPDPDENVGTADLLALLGNWGTSGPGACIADPPDVANTADLLELLGNWGACPEPPIENDNCGTDDVPLTIGGPAFEGDLSDNSDDSVTGTGGSCDGEFTAGEWFSIIGDGTTLTVSTCDEVDPFNDLGILVLCLGCGGECVAANLDGGGTCGQNAEASFCSIDGLEYKVLVYQQSGTPGSFSVSVTSNDTPCSTDNCQPTEGDDCNNPVEIFDGDTPFDTTEAGTDGPANPLGLCNDFDENQTHNDIWFVYEATCTGELTVSTCEDTGGSADYDTDLVVYDTTDCEALEENLLGCNDDDPDNDCGLLEFKSTVQVPVTQGNQYLIRVGGWSAADSGTGTLHIECGLPDPGACCLVDGTCVDGVSDDECDDLGGFYQGDGTDCVGVTCPDLACGVDDGQPTTPADGEWTFGVTDAGFPDDGTNPITRYEQTSVAAGTNITEICVEGVTTIVPGFAACTELSQTFEWAIFDGDPSDGGTEVCSGSETVNGAGTGELYGGTYELTQWCIPVDCASAPENAWIMLQASGGQLDCMFLWGSSDYGDGSHLIEDNAGIVPDNTFDVNYCINP